MSYDQQLADALRENERLERDLAAARSDNERLRGALEPFAEAIDYHDETTEIEGDPLPADEDEPWGEGLGDALTYGQWRAAREALGREEDRRAE